MEKSVIQLNGGIIINVYVSVKNVIMSKRIYLEYPSTCSCENGKYLASIMDNSTIMSNDKAKSNDEEQKTNFN